MRTTKATVRLGDIGHNLKTVMTLARSSKVLPVIKANAYGHGAIEVARKLESFRSSQVPAFAVAFMDEAVRLREAGIERPILVLQGCNQAADVAEAAAHNFWLMLHSPVQVEHVRRSDTRQPVKVWLKVDTGMRRLGLEVAELDSAFNNLTASENVQTGMVLCSHLACADDLASPATQRQTSQLQQLARQYQLPWSLANSAGIMGWPQCHGDWVRPGYMLYGNNPMKRALPDPDSNATADSGADSRSSSGSNSRSGVDLSSDANSNVSSEPGKPPHKLLPAMTMTSEIIAIRQVSAGDVVGYGHDWVASTDTTIGIVTIGYADGYPRHAKSGTPVWINGHRAKLAGRVSMDMLAVDLAGVENPAVGDQVELWGQNISVDEVAEHAGTIGYEILAGLSGRAPINYLP